MAPDSQWQGTHREVDLEEPRIKQQGEKFEEHAGCSKGAWPGSQKGGWFVDNKVPGTQKQRHQGEETKKPPAERGASFVVLTKMHVHDQGVTRT